MPPTADRSWRWNALRTAVTAALSAVVLAVAVSVLCWLPDAGTLGHPLSAVRAGLLAMLAGHHGGLTLDGVHAVLLPLGMLGVLVWIAHRAGLTLAVEDRAHPVVLIAVQTAAYTACCVALVPLAALGTSRVELLPTGIAAAAVFAVGSAAGFLRAGTWDLELPEWARLGLVAMGVYLGAGALLVAGSLVEHAHDVTTLSRQVGGGLAGLPVLILGVLTAPNGVIAGASYLAGPGFSVGAGTHVTPIHGGRGVEPAFPLLGALPGGGASPLVIGLMVVTVLGAGALVGRSAWVRSVDLGAALVTAGLAAPVAGAGLSLLAWLGGGGLGDGRLSTVGASPWEVGLVVPGEIAAGALLTVVALWAAARVTARGADDAGAVRTADEPADAHGPADADEPVGADL